MRHGICDLVRDHGAMREGLKVLRGLEGACTLAVELNQGTGNRCFDAKMLPSGHRVISSSYALPKHRPRLEI